MATLATPPIAQPANRLLGLRLPPGKQIGPPARPQPAPQPLQTRLEEPGLWAMLVWLAVGPAALLLVVFLWPVLLVALVLLLVGLTPFVVGLKVLATLRRGRRAVG